MISWTDDAIVLNNRPHAENHSILRVFSATHGAVAGLVFGGQGRTKGPSLQPGNGVSVSFSSRTDDQLGQLDVELDCPRAAAAMTDRKAALALSAVTELLHAVLPDNMPYPPLFAATTALLDHVDHGAIWPILLVKWELGLLNALGYGLTLDRCVASGQLLEDGAELVFVSPKSGGAVSARAGAPYKDRLLPLPPFVIEMGEPTRPDVLAALRLSGFFLEDRLLQQAGKALPESRERYISRWGKA